jgi:cobalt-zinc-cadmium efflux system protein
LWEAVDRLRSPEWVSGEAVSLTAAVGIGLNLASAKLLHSGSKHDTSIRTAYVHQVIDVAQSAGVVAAGLIIMWSDWNLVDPIAGIVISALVILMVWSVFSEAVSSAVQGVPSEIDAVAVIKYFNGLPGVIEVHNFHIFPVSTVETTLTTHVVLDRGAALCLHEIEHELASQFGISDSTVQPEFLDEECRHKGHVYGRVDLELACANHVH